MGGLFSEGHLIKKSDIITKACPNLECKDRVFQIFYLT
jgi:hypothetical protein